jgi:hypothetical protein
LVAHGGDVRRDPRSAHQLGGAGVGGVAAALGDPLVGAAGGHAGQDEVGEQAVARVQRLGRDLGGPHAFRRDAPVHDRLGRRRWPLDVRHGLVQRALALADLLGEILERRAPRPAHARWGRGTCATWSAGLGLRLILG